MVEQAVNELPEHHRIIFVLRELEGKSYEDIAEITGCRLGTVKSRLNRARNKFATLISPLINWRHNQALFAGDSWFYVGARTGVFSCPARVFASLVKF